jgi:hypothetical protein
MTIEKGEDWGSRANLDRDAPIVSSDRAIAELFEIDSNGDSLQLVGPAQVGLIGARDPAGPKTAKPAPTHDLARTVSARGSSVNLREGERSHLPLDLAVVTIDGVNHVLAASLVIRRPLWTGNVSAVMNASFLGEWNVAPAGHPNDGRLDVIDAHLSTGDRLKARTRLASGTHLPHPGISIRRLKAGELTPEHQAIVRLDGVVLGRVEHVTFTVFPDATTLVI